MIKNNSQPIIETLLNVIGNTAGIWLTFVVISLFYEGIIEDNHWTGFLYFIVDGSLLIITYSFLTTILITSFKNFELNKYNISALVILITTSVLYARHLGIKSNTTEESLNLEWYLWVPFILSIILLFLTLLSDSRKRGKSNWLSNRNNSFSIDKKYSVFLSYSIAGCKTKTQREKIQNEIKAIQNELSGLGYSPIFSADNHNLKEGYPPPAEAAELDFKAIENSKNFLFYYPISTPTSAILELGYALRDEDNILILTPNKEILPFLVRGLNEISNKVRIVEFTDTEHILSIIRTSHQSYFIK